MTAITLLACRAAPQHSAARRPAAQRPQLAARVPAAPRRACWRARSSTESAEQAPEAEALEPSQEGAPLPAHSAGQRGAAHLRCPCRASERKLASAAAAQTAACRLPAPPRRPPAAADVEELSEHYTDVMRERMGSAVLTYRHEDGTNYTRILDDLIVGSCLQASDGWQAACCLLLVPWPCSHARQRLLLSPVASCRHCAARPVDAARGGMAERRRGAAGAPACTAAGGQLRSRPLLLLLPCRRQRTWTMWPTARACAPSCACRRAPLCLPGQRHGPLCPTSRTLPTSRPAELLNCCAAVLLSRSTPHHPPAGGQRHGLL